MKRFINTSLDTETWGMGFWGKRVGGLGVLGGVGVGDVGEGERWRMELGEGR